MVMEGFLFHLFLFRAMADHYYLHFEATADHCYLHFEAKADHCYLLFGTEELIFSLLFVE
jgi:hypothetical protein